MFLCLKKIASWQLNNKYEFSKNVVYRVQVPILNNFNSRIIKVYIVIKNLLGESLCYILLVYRVICIMVYVIYVHKHIDVNSVALFLSDSWR